MGNAFEPPKVDKRQNAVAVQVAAEVKEAEAPRVPTTPATIYKNGIDTFVRFLKGEVFGGSLEERKKYQLQFVDSIWPMLELSDALLKDILDHFVIQIVENKDVFNYNSVCAPLFSVESDRATDVMTRYKQFMLFIIMYAENARDRQRFLAMYDVPRFTNTLTPIAKQRLTNYVYR
ncbi:hypothetical protein OBP_095 [Pseudomonas phage OBP]|uniref:hypothetical protein n=1 Tax=Pseudomonas phage OBP TaxID=1124849 RepID=UPI000240D43D|nr:hypothetical protein OBP_095 [Pseudomonas phage OBP]AEV89532.1 hypothetical protein OBP_095 [Pseudomonas phage OBP]